MARRQVRIVIVGLAVASRRRDRAAAATSSLPCRATRKWKRRRARGIVAPDRPRRVSDRGAQSAAASPAAARVARERIVIAASAGVRCAATSAAGDGVADVVAGGGEIVRGSRRRSPAVEPDRVAGAAAARRDSRTAPGRCRRSARGVSRRRAQAAASVGDIATRSGSGWLMHGAAKFERGRRGSLGLEGDRAR